MDLLVVAPAALETVGAALPEAPSPRDQRSSKFADDGLDECVAWDAGAFPAKDARTGEIGLLAVLPLA